MHNFCDHRVVATLPDPLFKFLESEAARTGLPRSAIIRQALSLRQAQVRRNAANELEVFE